MIKVLAFAFAAALVALPPTVASAQNDYSVGPAAAPPIAEPNGGVALGPLTPLDSRFQNLQGDELFARLQQHNESREAHLKQYSVVRTYAVTNPEGKLYAQEVVKVQYRAPSQKSFVTDSETGSSLVRELVLKRLVESESETASGRAHRDSSIKPENYELRLAGEQDVGGRHCLVADAIPKRRDKYLFEGRVWIDAEDYAIVRISGRPAKAVSFWITRADFVRQYQKIGDFWLPLKDETFVQVRFNGRKILTVNYRDYMVNGTPQAAYQSHSGPLS